MALNRSTSLLAAAVAALLVLTACSRGGDGPASQDEATVPLPAKPPGANGKADAPAMVPRVLLKATDRQDAELGVAGEDAFSDRTSGAVVTDRAVVAYTVDNVAGYSLTSGKKLWTAKLDMGTGSICWFSDPESSKVKTVSLAFSTDGRLCTRIVTLSVASGKVLHDIDLRKGGWGQDPDGFSIGYVADGVTVADKDYLLDNRNTIYEVGGTTPIAVGTLGEGVRTFRFAQAANSRTFIVPVRSDDGAGCRIEGYTLTPFKKLWSVDATKLQPPEEKDCLFVPYTKDASWLTSEGSSKHVLLKLDPATGDVVGRRVVDKSEQPPKDQFHQNFAAIFEDAALGVKGGDIIVRQPFGLARFSMKGQKLVWRFDGTAMLLKNDPDDLLDDAPDFNPRALSGDGKYVVATATNATTSEILVLEVRTGKLRARWPVPPKYADGFAVEPRLALFDKGVVLVRDFENWDREYLTDPDPAKTKDVFDVGIFTWPKVEESKD